MAVNIRVRNKHGYEQMMKTFRTAVKVAGILSEVRERKSYHKPSEIKHRKQRKARSQR